MMDSFETTPKKVGQIGGEVFGLDRLVDVVEVKCPVCGCSRLDDLGDKYRCCACGMEFKTVYPQDKTA